MLPLLLALTAQGGALEITVSEPVAIHLDDALLRYEPDTTVTFARGVTGRHRVTVRDIGGQEVWSGSVDVPHDKLLRCIWQRMDLNCYQRVKLPPRLHAEPQYHDVSLHMGGTGVSVHVEEHGHSSHGHHSDPPPQVIVVEAPPEPPPPPLPSRVRLVVRSSDGEWADVLVDGAVVMEFRNKKEMETWISPGKHHIEVREFMEDRPYAKGRLETGYADHITLGITEGRPIQAYDTDGFFPQ